MRRMCTDAAANRYSMNTQCGDEWAGPGYGQEGADSAPAGRFVDGYGVLFEDLRQGLPLVHFTAQPEPIGH